MHHETVVGEFSHQAESFNAFAGARAGELQELVRLASPAADERWLDAACGPGVVSRALAAHVREVVGTDATPAMVEVARREAAAAGVDNARYAVGDVTGLDLPAGSFDGAVARFIVHHLPVPARLFEELVRVVRPGGTVVVVDHVADDDPDAAAWTQEVERLRDPSHWTSLRVERLRALGASAGLTLERERIVPLELDFDDWLDRGSGGASARPLIERLLRERPERAESFEVAQSGGRRTLRLRMWLSRWRR